MAKLRIETLIDAPREVCFDLIRDPRVLGSGADVKGEFSLGQSITFQSRWLGFEQDLQIRVAEFERPRRFVDVMTAGKFRSFFHAHEFEDVGDATRLIDTLEWETPYGILGKLFDAIILSRRLKKIVTERNTKLKELAKLHGG